MTAARAISLCLALSIVGSAALLVVYVSGGNPALEGIGLAGALGGLGAGIVIWSAMLLESPTESEPWHTMSSSEEQRAGATEALDADQISRRRFLVRLLAGATAVLTGALLLPAFSLGPAPGQDLFRTAWRRGLRVVDASGQPVKPDQMPLDSVRTVFPAGSVGRPDSQTLLIKVRPGDLAIPNGRNAWAPQGCVAYSKVCTHAGCPVGLYRAQQHELLCPCHQSTFDVLHGAVPVFGPAARPLPQLPLEIDDQGFLVAGGDFPEPIGPGFWDMTHTPSGEI
jgi:ubiquinol-cytochrome c reductase iron-sulfur subunit